MIALAVLLTLASAVFFSTCTAARCFALTGNISRTSIAGHVADRAFPPGFANQRLVDELASSICVNSANAREKQRSIFRRTISNCADSHI